MIQEFLNFVDVQTNFGAIHISAERLFRMFVEYKGIGDNHAYGFRIRLQRKGIL